MEWWIYVAIGVVILLLILLVLWVAYRQSKDPGTALVTKKDCTPDSSSMNVNNIISKLNNMKSGVQYEPATYESIMSMGNTLLNDFKYPPHYQDCIREAISLASQRLTQDAMSSG